MTLQEQQKQHTLLKDNKMVDQVKVRLVKGFELMVVVCDHASNSLKQMVVSFDIRKRQDYLNDLDSLCLISKFSRIKEKIFK